jgi:hypothetical protein
MNLIKFNDFVLLNLVFIESHDNKNKHAWKSHELKLKEKKHYGGCTKKKCLLILYIKNTTIIIIESKNQTIFNKIIP